VVRQILFAIVLELVTSPAQRLKILDDVVVPIPVAMVDDQLLCRSASLARVFSELPVRLYATAPMAVGLADAENTLSFGRLKFAEAGARARASSLESSARDREDRSAVLARRGNPFAIIPANLLSIGRIPAVNGTEHSLALAEPIAACAAESHARNLISTDRRRECFRA